MRKTEQVLEKSNVIIHPAPTFFLDDSHGNEPFSHLQSIPCPKQASIFLTIRGVRKLPNNLLSALINISWSV
jgi:hypothetical protein